MKILLDIFSIFLFFITYHIFNIFIATIVLMIISLIVCIIHYYVYQTIDIINIINCIIIFIFGSFTIIFHNPEFIKWKITILYFLLALILILIPKMKKQTLLESILCQYYSLSNQEWKKINIIWSLFFLLCSVLNLYIAYHFSENFWVYFKMFGLSGIIILFTLLNILYIKNIKK
ncbi:Probable intracellular septation protein A [Buchnera aphidicola (Eriosoma lanigerum)]|uniref:septation protein IspZ n=1 Tax=Buchnera aphidicola TaxID=9 RepID=UPI0034642365